jgi:hypothetical protein
VAIAAAISNPLGLIEPIRKRAVGVAASPTPTATNPRRAMPRADAMADASRAAPMATLQNRIA